MKIVKLGEWVYYLEEEHELLSSENAGKWMYFFDNREFAEYICKKAIEEKVVLEAKHSDDEKGVACFYLVSNDISGHKKLIEFFLINDLIRQTKSGKLYNIPFKLNNQTINGEYGDNFKAEIKLEKFIDLNTRKWKI